MIQILKIHLYVYSVQFVVFYCICRKSLDPKITFWCVILYSWRHKPVPALLSKHKQKVWCKEARIRCEFVINTCSASALFLSAATALAFALVSLARPLVAPCFSLSVLWLIHNEVSVLDKARPFHSTGEALIMDCQLWWVFLQIMLSWVTFYFLTKNRGEDEFIFGTDIHINSTFYSFAAKQFYRKWINCITHTVVVCKRKQIK